MNILESLKDKSGGAISYIKNFNTIAIDTLESSSKRNLSTMSYLVDVGVRQLRGLSSVKNFESLRQFTSESVTLNGEIAKRLLEDGKTWLHLGADLKEKVGNTLSQVTSQTEASVESEASAMENDIKRKAKAAMK